MTRWFLVALALLLAGCATHRDYYYNDGYYADAGYYDRYDRYGYGGDSYYAPGYGGYGDYWYGDYDYRYSGYLHYPSYYSVYWPMHRWYHPYGYPGFYYGVTFFPRNYLSLGISYGWPRYGHGFAYSPYRYGWSDWYYDWYPYYAYNPRYRDHYRLPRHGSARAEAERLARLAGTDRFAAKRSVLPGRVDRAGLRGIDRDGRRDAARGAGPREVHTLPRRDVGARELPARGIERGAGGGVERGLERGRERGVDRGLDRGRVDAPLSRAPAVREARRLPVDARRRSDDDALRRTLREEGVPLRTRTVTIPPRDTTPRLGAREVGRGYERRGDAYGRYDRGAYERGDRGDYGHRGYDRSDAGRAPYGGRDYGNPVRSSMPVREAAPPHREFTREAPPQYRAPEPSYAPPPAREAPSRSASFESRSESSSSSRGERASSRRSVRER